MWKGAQQTARGEIVFSGSRKSGGYFVSHYSAEQACSED